MEEWITHPNNRAAIESALEDANAHVRRDTWSPLAMMPSFLSIPIRFDSSLPERDIEERWRPPADSRFCGYGPEDEHWMRPLGLGRFEYIDNGPLIYKINLPMFRVLNDYGPMMGGRNIMKSSGI